ncbi:CBS domain-containing protein [Paraburkholderia sp. B3]|uniref:CBS domain-containing protein n=1 Tax=Paraburkholderia sp. B3 TaxID=3134791 RepID=UPI003982AE07
MTQVYEIMSRNVVRVTPESTIRHAAQLMRRHDIGALPICDGDHVVGMVTDRDLAVRALTAGYEPMEPVARVASSDVQCCYEDDDLDVVQRRMGEAQVRRVPVVNHARELVGTLSLADIATRCDGQQRQSVANTLEDISQRRVR